MILHEAPLGAPVQSESITPFTATPFSQQLQRRYNAVTHFTPYTPDLMHLQQQLEQNAHKNQIVKENRDSTRF